jgi:hypothetical protein
LEFGLLSKHDFQKMKYLKDSTGLVELLPKMHEKETQGMSTSCFQTQEQHVDPYFGTLIKHSQDVIERPGVECVK